AAEIDAGHRASGARSGAVGRQRDGKGGALEAFAQARGDEADDAWMPGSRRKDQDWRPLPAPNLAFGRAVGFLERLEFDALALDVEFVEARGNHQGGMVVVQTEELCPERRVPDTPAGVDARADDESEVIGDQ